MKWLVSLLTFILWLTGCQLLPATPDPETRLRPAASIEPHSSSSGAGRLAYIGNDGNVYVTTAALTHTVKVTRDATTGPENIGFSYHRISWSPAGQLAFAGVTRSLTETQSDLYVADPDGQAARLVAHNEQHFVIYIFWAPTSCLQRPDCYRLAYLVEVEDQDIGLYLVEIDQGKVENRLLGQGRPFYFSWASDGQQMVWHTGGARRFNPEAQLVLYDIGQAQATLLPDVPGLFLSPAWTSGSLAQWLGVLAEENNDQLHRFEAGQPVEFIAGTDNNAITFTWSPEGRRVAYAIRRQGNDPAYGPIHLFQLDNGQSRLITDAPFRIVAFFWSPDGQKIGYLIQPSPEADWLQWRVYDLEQEQDRGYQLFTPSYQTQYVMSSFNQYAQSHRFWSPDSRYLVYADRDERQIERVWLIDTWAERGASPILVGEGTFGVWSWN